MPRIHGLVAAPFTPFTSAGELNLPVVDSQAKSLAANGVVGAFVCGTTGEGASMATDERQALVRQWRQVAPKGLRLIVHVGHCSLREGLALAEHAQECGADAIAAIAPYFFKPANVDDLVGFCRELAMAAPKLPFYYYHLPSISGVNFPMIDFLRASIGKIPTLAGIKFTYENLMDYAQCLDFEGGAFDMLFGRDEILLAGLALGAQGAVGSTYNYAAPVYVRMMEAFAQGDLAKARLWQARSREIIDVLIRCGGQPAGKAMMKLAGIDCGPCRRPLARFTAAQHRKMVEQLKARDLLKWFNR